MLSFTGSLKVFVARDPSDLRRSGEGLHAAVGGKFKADVRGGAILAAGLSAKYAHRLALKNSIRW